MCFARLTGLDSCGGLAKERTERPSIETPEEAAARRQAKKQRKNKADKLRKKASKQACFNGDARHPRESGGGRANSAVAASDASSSSRLSAQAVVANASSNSSKSAASAAGGQLRGAPSVVLTPSKSTEALSRATHDEREHRQSLSDERSEAQVHYFIFSGSAAGSSSTTTATPPQKARKSVRGKGARVARGGTRSRP